jgi:DNA modification methylase
LVAPYYDDGAVTVYHGDCREILPSLAADVFVTDPPYGVDLAARSTKRAVRLGSYTCFEDTPEYVEAVAVPVVRDLLARGMRGALTPGVRNMWRYPGPADVGTIWSAAGAGMSSWGFQCSHPIFYYGKDPYLARGLGSRPNGLAWNNATEENGHPCPKPLAVMLWLVNRVSWVGDTVLDPFAGSGTTLRAAKDLNRRAIGIEIEERYCEIAARRCAQDVLDLTA